MGVWRAARARSRLSHRRRLPQIQNFFEKVGISRKDCCNYTILNSDVICTYEQLQNGLEETDAVIITKPNQYVYLNFGDCIPLVVFDNQKNILGFAHMGWNSICKDLHMKLIRYMMQNYESELKDLTVYFGPSISSDSYAFANPAQKDMPEWKDFLYKENDLYHIDLVGYIIQGLEKLGIDQREIIKNNVSEERIEESVKRILEFKYTYLKNNLLDQSYLGSEEHQAIINKISITN